MRRSSGLSQAWPWWAYRPVDPHECALGRAESEFLKLPPAERSLLLPRLIASLAIDPEVEAAWGREADHREAALASGDIEDVRGHEAIARLQARQSDQITST